MTEGGLGERAEAPVEPVEAMEVLLIGSEQVTGSLKAQGMTVLPMQAEELCRRYDGIVGIGDGPSIGCLAPRTREPVTRLPLAGESRHGLHIHRLHLTQEAFLKAGDHPLLGLSESVDILDGVEAVAREGIADLLL